MSPDPSRPSWRELLPARPQDTLDSPLPLPVLAPLNPAGGLRDRPSTSWRYREAFPFFADLDPVTLGEGKVPLERVAFPALPRPLWVLRDDLQPTGSWKDRGTASLVTALREAGLTRLVEDSSGNAALSLAVYCKALGLDLTACVPASASSVKKTLIQQAGARLLEVPGPRGAATHAAMEQARRGAYWAAHALQPLHAVGAATAAFNIVEELGRVPEVVVVPVGHGGLLAGIHSGFSAVRSATGERLPAMVGVQSDRCAPLVRAFRHPGERAIEAEEAGGGLAEGVLVGQPQRGSEALRAARESGGTIASADDFAVDRAMRLLWLEGLTVEPTAALPLAWLLGHPDLPRLGGDGDVVLVLTGHGIRSGLALH